MALPTFDRSKAIGYKLKSGEKTAQLLSKCVYQIIKHQRKVAGGFCDSVICTIYFKMNILLLVDGGL